MPDARRPRPRRSRPRPPETASGSTAAEPLTKLVELLQRLERAERGRVQLLDLLAQWIGSHLHRQPELHLGRLQRALALELAEDIARPGDDRRRQARDGGDVDAVRTVRTTGDDAMQEPHSIALLEHLDALVAQSRQPFGERG